MAVGDQQGQCGFLTRPSWAAGGLGRCGRFFLSGEGQQVPVQGSACQQAAPESPCPLTARHQQRDSNKLQV